VEKMKIGVIGCGKISDIYLKMAATFEVIEVAAVADIVIERAQAKAEQYGVKACSVDEMLGDPSIAIILNLTIPAAHYSVAMAALNAGKSVYNEKPLTISRAEGQELLALAAQKGLRVGGAPDTFLGAGIQTCRKLIDDGMIGVPVAAAAFMTCRGHESWHPDPEFYYQIGGGPMFDMGPYYLTALINLLGPVRRVTGSARKSFSERMITSQPKAGKIIQVEVPTHVAGVLDFAGGAVGTIITSFDVWKASLPRIEIYGSEGSLSVPDPNTFGGPVRIFRPGQSDWEDVPLAFGHAQNSRSLGVADMASAIRNNRPHRASGELCYHVLDIMHAFHDASQQDRHVALTSTCDRPAALPLGLADHQFD